MTGQKFYDWGHLRNGGKSVLKKLSNEWTTKLSDKALSEHDYHSFLSEHAGLFFDQHNKSLQCISKLKFGSEYETDFVAIHEGYSEGIIYELIEIESPHSSAYTKKGQPTARLTTALQQIQNWQNWLLENRNEFTRMFPNYNKKIIRDSNLRYTIIIGRRDENDNYIEERNTLSEKHGIKIRSFDYLTDNLKDKMTSVYERPMIFSSEMDSLPKIILNQLANPFYKATTDSQWKEMRREIKANFHYFAKNQEVILKYRNYNQLLDRFIKNYERVLK